MAAGRRRSGDCKRRRDFKPCVAFAKVPGLRRWDAGRFVSALITLIVPTQSVGTIDKDRIDNGSAFIARKKSCCIDPVSLVSLCGRIAMLIQRQ